jgi:hypothetical protein
MLLPFPTNPSLPSNPAPLFGDTAAVRGDHIRANNAEIWANFAVLETLIPVGAVMPLIQAYFSVGNGSPVPVAIDLPDIWHECDGTAPNDADSPIWNAAGRYLPDLTGDIFLMGAAAALNRRCAFETTSCLVSARHRFVRSMPRISERVSSK